MSRTPEAPTSSFPSAEPTTEARRRYDSLLRPGSIEIVWDDEPRTLRDPRRADRIAAEVPVVLSAA